MNPSQITPGALQRLTRAAILRVHLADGRTPTGKVVVISYITLGRVTLILIICGPGNGHKCSRHRIFVSVRSPA